MEKLDFLKNIFGMVRNYSFTFNGESITVTCYGGKMDKRILDILLIVITNHYFKIQKMVDQH
jgi:hypothetical protein